MSAAEFYRTRRGEVAAQILRTRIDALWQGLAGQSVLGIGYPQPYMQLWRGTAYRCLAATSSHHALPLEAQAACAIEPARLPFPDLSFDRILIIHGVEPSGHDERLLREIWRVLKDDGRILVVAPNRMGLWGHAEATPFGQGQLYSRSQIALLLAGAMFRVERRDAALFTPPTRLRALLAGHRLWEGIGRWVAPNLSGVTLTEAVKDIYAALPTEAVQRRVVLQEAA